MAIGLKRFVLIMLSSLLPSCAAPTHGGATADTPHHLTLFRQGDGPYNNYRIPSIIRTKSGTLLAFCEGRQTPLGPGNDTGEINLILRRSTDAGRTFGPIQVVWADGKDTCGNPCPVVDQSTGTVFLLMTHNLGGDHEKDIIAGTSKGTRTVWITSSADDGQTWSPPRDITPQVKSPAWRWFATGPGVGIQLTQGPYAGRLVIPCDYITQEQQGGQPTGNSLVIYSDDHGTTWHTGGESPTPGFNESQIAELSDGRILLNMRNVPPAPPPTPDPPPIAATPRVARPPTGPETLTRGVCLSTDGGETFSDLRHDPALIEPRCQASLLRYADTGGHPHLLFANPASTIDRSHMTIRLSDDDGRTWPFSKEIVPGPSAYSSLVPLPDDHVGLLYEAGDHHRYERIDFTTLSLAWLTAGTKSTDWNWQRLPDVPNPQGVAGAFAGESNGALIVAGGANFPDAPPWRGGHKACYSAIHVLLPVDGGYRWAANAGSLPHALSYGVSVQTDRGVLLVGGCDAERCYSDVYRVRWSAERGVQTEALPGLPRPLAYMAGALVGNTVYVAGGQETVADAHATSHFYALDLSREGTPEFGWRELPAWPGDPRIVPVACALGQGGDAAFYLFSGRNVQAGQIPQPLSDAYRFSPPLGRWETLPSPPRCLMAASSLPSGAHTLLLLGGDDGKLFTSIEQLRREHREAELNDALEHHPGFSAEIVEFDAVALRYRAAGTLPHPAPVTTPAVPWRGGVLLPSGEVRPGVRSPAVWFATPPARSPG